MLLGHSFLIIIIIIIIIIICTGESPYRKLHSDEKMAQHFLVKFGENTLN